MFNIFIRKFDKKAVAIVNYQRWANQHCYCKLVISFSVMLFWSTQHYNSVPYYYAILNTSVKTFPMLRT